MATSLDPHEISPLATEGTTPWGCRVAATDPDVVFRHSGWQRARRCVRVAMHAARLSQRTITRYDLCGSDTWVAVSLDSPDRVALLANHCRSRWCLPCARARAHVIATNLRAALDGRHVRFLTLTLKHRAVGLRRQLDRLYASFAKLRAPALWRPHVNGGAVMCECKHSHRGPLWHPHLHILFEGRYLPQRRLSDEWKRITGDSSIVDVRAVPNVDAAAKYVTKYVSKPYDSAVINKPDAIAELITAMHRRRLVGTFGTWRGIRLCQPLDNTRWQMLLPLYTLINDTRLGLPGAVDLLRRVADKYPKLVLACREHPP
jgi:hypothetical protein